MTWVHVSFYRWTCDGCGLEHTEDDEYQPIDWIHTQDGRDLCVECQR